MNADGFCTIHQHLSADGYPKVQGSRVRLPDGSEIPGVTRVTIEAVPGNVWRTTIELMAVFGEPIRDLPHPDPMAERALPGEDEESSECLT